MIAELAGLFRGDLAPVGAALVVNDHTRRFELVADLTQDDGMAAILQRFSTLYQHPEPRAVASQWSKIYFSKLIVPTVSASLMLDWRLPLDVDETGIVLDELGRPQAFYLAGPGLAMPRETAEERFSFVTRTHIASVIDAIARVSGLSHKVLWSNAGNVVENVICYCERLAPKHNSVEQARLHLATRRLSDGEMNPLFEPARYLMLDGAKIRKRRVCCIRYLMPCLEYCKTCPILKRDVR
jgi:ferric iron reductase protein FhuF